MPTISSEQFNVVARRFDALTTTSAAHASRAPGDTLIGFVAQLVGESDVRFFDWTPARESHAADSMDGIIVFVTEHEIVRVTYSAANVFAEERDLTQSAGRADVVVHPIGSVQSIGWDVPDIRTGRAGYGGSGITIGGDGWMVTLPVDHRRGDAARFDHLAALRQAIFAS